MALLWNLNQRKVLITMLPSSIIVFTLNSSKLILLAKISLVRSNIDFLWCVRRFWNNNFILWSSSLKWIILVWRIQYIQYQNPSLLLNLDLSTYSWMCSEATGSSTTSFVLKETYLEGSKSAGLWWSAPFLCLHPSTSDI